MKPRLLITDLDGTLLPMGSDHARPGWIELLCSLSERGIRVTIATGKPFARALPLAQQLGIDGPIICANGALIQDTNTREILHRSPFSSDIIDALLRLAEDERYQLYAETEDALYYVDNPRIEVTAWRHARPGWTLVPEKFVPGESAFANLPHKIAVSGEPQVLFDLKKRLRDDWQGILNVYQPKPDIIDLTLGTVNKGTAATFLANHLGLAMSEIVSIGDEENDIPMLHATGTGIAMPNAIQPIIDIATHKLSDTEIPLADQLKRILFEGKLDNEGKRA